MVLGSSARARGGTFFGQYSQASDFPGFAQSGIQSNQIGLELTREP